MFHSADGLAPCGTRNPEKPMSSRILFRLCQAALFSGVLWSAGAQAQAPTPNDAGAPVARGAQLVGETVADRPSTVYRFETHRLDSADGKRHYRIQIAVPRQAAPAGGSAALYMLDGNAALATLTDADLLRSGAGGAPVLVAVGYDVPTRNDVVARAYDYTPPVFEQGARQPSPVVLGREGGGADEFLALLRERVKPLVRGRAAVDDRREYLWGHSYGGLFALHVLFTRPDTFARYITGDPSAWWADGALLQEWRRFDARRAAGKRVLVLAGTKPRDPARQRPNAPSTRPDGTPIDLQPAVRAMVEGLREGGADARYEAFAQFGHGEMLRVSLERALQVALEP